MPANIAAIYTYTLTRDHNVRLTIFCGAVSSSGLSGSELAMRVAKSSNQPSGTIIPSRRFMRDNMSLSSFMTLTIVFDYLF
jgi:hypothetical protein